MSNPPYRLCLIPPFSSLPAVAAKRALFPVAAALLIGACSEAPSGPSGLRSPDGAPATSTVQAVPDFVPGRVLASFLPGADRAALAAPHRASVGRELLLGGIWILHVPVGREQTIASALSQNPNVRFAEPDWIRTFGLPCETGDCTAPNDTYFGYKWDHHNDGDVPDRNGGGPVPTGKSDADIDWLEAFHQLTPTFTGSATIGIIDTGIFSSHPELTGKVVAEWDFVRNDNEADPEHWHGTHVAGIAAAYAHNGTGVAGVGYGSNINLVDAKVCTESGCSVSDVADGIKWAADNGADVVNLSLGGPIGSSTEQQALKYALNQGALPFCSSGNDGAGRLSYPAAFPECVAVGATDWGDDRASFSNRGKGLELAAPGGDTENAPYSYVLSTYYNPGDGFVGYAWAIGTSMAAPQATGLGALLHAYGVTGASTIRDRLKATADDLGKPGWDREFGHGRINAYRAINNITDGGGAPPPDPVTDIAVTAVSAPASVTQGNVVDVDVTVENVGNQDVTSDINVTLMDDTDGLTIGVQTIAGGLAAGASATLTYSWETGSASLGGHTLTAMHDFADDDATNTSKSTTVTVNEPTAGTAPVVDACTPDNGNPGDRLTVAVTGSGFQDGAMADFGERVTVQSVTFVSSSQLDVQIKVHRRASAGPRDVTVTNPDAQSGTKAACFTVN